MLEDERLLAQADRSVYIEASLPRVPDQNVEVWITRLFFPQNNVYVSAGLFIIPREFLYGNAEKERKCLVSVFGCLMEQLGKRNCMKIVMATKRNLGFLWRCEKVIQEMNPRAVVKICYVCYQQKIIQTIASQVTQITRSSDPNHQNLKEQELLFSHMKSLAHLPLRHLHTGLDVLKHFA